MSLNLLLYLIVAFLMIEPYRNIFIIIASAIFDEDTAPSIVTKFMGVPVVYLLTTEGFAIPLRWYVFSLILYASNYRSARTMSFRDVFLCVLFSEVILTLMRFVNVMFLYLRGLEAITEPHDLVIVPGLQLIFPDMQAQYSLFTLASNYNIFSLWYVATLGLGFAVMFGVPRLRAFLWSLICWNTWIGLLILKPHIEKLIIGPFRL